jgi:hypothetical protein
MAYIAMKNVNRTRVVSLLKLSCDMFIIPFYGNMRYASSAANSHVSSSVRARPMAIRATKMIDALNAVSEKLLCNNFARLLFHSLIITISNP